MALLNNELCRHDAPARAETAWEVFLTAVLLAALQAFANKPNRLQIRINKQTVLGLT
jgi:hypothetical protein